MQKNEKLVSLLRGVVNATPDLIFAKDLDLVYIACNESFCKFVDKPEANVVGFRDEDLFEDPEVVEWFRQADRELLRLKKEVRVDEWVKFPDGSDVLLDTLKSPFYDEEGNLVGLLGVSRDITEKRKFEEVLLEQKERAEKASLAKTSFLAHMSHELRTPLNAIIGFANIVSKDDTLREETSKFIDIINMSGQHLLSMINDVLDITKIEAGKLELQAVPCDILQSLNNVSDMISFRVQESSLKFMSDFSKIQQQYVLVDPGKLRQVLINLLDNAMKFTQDGFISLHVSSQKMEERVNFQLYQIVIEDTGIGIPEEKLGSVFEEFEQARPGDSDHPAGGTGLGLSITKKLVQMMGGEIHLESKFQEGTKITLTIPFENVEEDAVRTISHEQSLKRVRKLKKGQRDFLILLVEDNPINMLLLNHLMRSIGFSTIQAVNGQEAIDAFVEHKPDFIWMDMNMPVMNGYEAIPRIRTLPGGEKVKICALTVSAFESERQAIAKLGCDQVALKPLVESEIFSILQEQLGIEYSQ